jgi:hypothetical protein
MVAICEDAQREAHFTLRERLQQPSSVTALCSPNTFGLNSITISATLMLKGARRMSNKALELALTTLYEIISL